MTTTKPVGRPRMYLGASEKMAAFRERQSSAGYLRREVLMSPTAALRVKELATQENVSTVDVASALFELGLQQYDGQLQASAFLSSSTSQGALGQASNALGTPVASCTAVANAQPLDSNPIQRFFAQRKESAHD